MKCLYCDKSMPKKRYYTEAYHSWDTDAPIGYRVVDRQTGKECDYSTSRNQALYIARKLNKEDGQPGISHQGLCPECREKYARDARITVKLSEAVVLDFRRYARELREAEKQLKVPLTSAATALQIRNAMGLAAVCLEALLWAIDEQAKEGKSS